MAMKLTLNEGEEILRVAHRHPVGVTFKIVPHLVFLVSFWMLFTLSYIPFLSTFDWYVAIIPFIRLVLIAGVIIGWLTINTTILLIYFLSSFILTNQRVVKIKQEGIFSRLMFIADLDRVQDVQVEQRGLIPHFYNYGTLRVETASEAGEVFFKELPHPSDFQRDIFNAINASQAAHGSPRAPGEASGNTMGL